MAIRGHRVFILWLSTKHKLLDDVTLNCPGDSLKSFSKWKDNKLGNFLKRRCWNLLSAASGPTGVNNGDNRVTCTGAIALLI
jgi:hypothetical protein